MKSKVRKFEFGVRILDGTRGTNGMYLGMTRPDGSWMKLPEALEIRAAHDLHGPWLCHFPLEHDHLADEFVRRWNAHSDLLAACEAVLRAYESHQLYDKCPADLVRAAIAKAYGESAEQEDGQCQSEKSKS